MLKVFVSKPLAPKFSVGLPPPSLSWLPCGGFCQLWDHPLPASHQADWDGGVGTRQLRGCLSAMRGGPMRTDSAFSDAFLGLVLVTFTNPILGCKISKNTHGGGSQNSMWWCSHPPRGHSSDTSLMVLGESRNLWASPEKISLAGIF